jgi:Protein of unknown function (DUF4256)
MSKISSTKGKPAYQTGRLQSEQSEELLLVLRERFEKNKNRHKGIDWNKVQAKLEANAEKLWSLNEMERTGGEPDVVSYDKKIRRLPAGRLEYIFYDCSAESPAGRRSICYDHEALEARKENKPKNSAIGMAAEMGIEILTEEQYRELSRQLAGEKFDMVSWIAKDLKANVSTQKH